MLVQDRDREGFNDRLFGSKPAVMVVAEYLRMKFPDCEIITPELVASPDYEHRMEYLDNGDIFVKCSDETRRYEVKGSSHWFINVETLPKNWEGSVIVCRQYTFDDADPKPVAYFIVNNKKSMAILIDVAATRAHWVKKDIYPGNYPGTCEEDYVVSDGLVKFVNLTDARRRYLAKSVKMERVA